MVFHRPILFILYINDLPRVITKLKFLLYADDTNILYENTDANAIIKTINMEMPKIMEWFKSNKLHLNVNKSVAMLFHTRQKRVNIDDISIVIDGKTVSVLFPNFCVLPVAVTGSPNLLCCILRYFIDFAFCCCAI